MRFITFQVFNILIAGFFILFHKPVLAQDLTRLGGDLTSEALPEVALELPAPNISSAERIQEHLASHEDFHISFSDVKKNGKNILGPFFNHDSCGNCHIKNGRGAISFSRGSSGSNMIIKVSLKNRFSGGAPRDVPGIGEQLQDHKLAGKSLYNIRLGWLKVRGSFPDGTKYVLRRPKLSFNLPGVKNKKVVTSLRMTPPVIGMGLLEAIPDETLEMLSDPHDLNNDGISGRVSLVPDRENGRIAVGRFGFRATHPTVKQQSAAAFFHDMGITNPLFPAKNGDSELTSAQLERVTFYQQAAGVTPARDQEAPDVIAGKAIFQEINCNGCHVMTLKTGVSSVPEVSNQEFHPFTDLLLHDMGADLSDERPEFSASGREWRTTPLWGIGLHELLSDQAPGFLHDGRARTLEEAILWHGGEAQNSRLMYIHLTKDKRLQLIKFLRSL